MRSIIIFSGFLALSCTMALGQTLKVISPNGGESWPKGDARTITWQAAGISGNVRIVLRHYGGAKVGDIAVGVPAAQGSFSWTVGNLVGGGTAPTGEGFVVRVRTEDSQHSDDSDAGFRIYRQVSLSQQQTPEPQVGQNQPPDYSGLSGMPDLALTDVEYKPAQHLIALRIQNVGIATYSGMLHIQMEAADGGCWNRELYHNIPHLDPQQYFITNSFNNCDYFPAPCGHRFVVTLKPDAPELNKQNNVFDGLLHRDPGGHITVPASPPIRIRFSHGSKSLTCDSYVYNQANTITPDDIRNDLGPQPGTALITLEIPVYNCGGSNAMGNIWLRIKHRRGSVFETLYDYVMVENPQGLHSGDSRLLSRTFVIPIREGEYYVCPDATSGSCQCAVAFKFSSAFFD